MINIGVQNGLNISPVTDLTVTTQIHVELVQCPKTEGAHITIAIRTIRIILQENYFGLVANLNNDNGF